MPSRPNTATSREYPAGTVLFKERDVGDRMYVIRKGRIKIFRDAGEQELVLAFLGPGDFLGEMALLEGLPRSASAMVVEPAILIEVEAATFEAMIRRNIEIAVRIMRKLSGRVRALDGRLEKLLVDDAQGRTLEVLRWLLPQGIIDGDWIRVRNIVPQLDIAAQAGVSQEQAERVVRRLHAAGCVRVEGDDILIAERRVLDSYQSFLQLQRRYGRSSAEEGGTAAPLNTPQDSLRRLLTALELDDQEIAKRQAALVEEYERYRELKRRFGDVDEA